MWNEILMRWAKLPKRGKARTIQPGFLFSGYCNDDYWWDEYRVKKKKHSPYYGHPTITYNSYFSEGHSTWSLLKEWTTAENPR